MHIHKISQSRKRASVTPPPKRMPRNLCAKPARAVREQSLVGCKESGASPGLCLGLENKDKTQKESSYLSPRLE